MSRKAILLMWMASFSLTGHCQGFINYENVASTTLKDKYGNKYGTGNLQRISGRFSLPLSRSLNERNQPTAWGLTLSASYSKMNNEEEAQELNPAEVLNTTLTISHTRPLSERWSLQASLGAGIYAMPDEIRWQSILANGAVFFIYRLHDNLSIGLGGGLTNSYGAPILLPMGYLNWKTNGRYNFIIDVCNLAYNVPILLLMGLFDWSIISHKNTHTGGIIPSLASILFSTICIPLLLGGIAIL